jgi:hypothetical protein
MSKPLPVSLSILSVLITVFAVFFAISNVSYASVNPGENATTSSPTPTNSNSTLGLSGVFNSSNNSNYSNLNQGTQNSNKELHDNTMSNTSLTNITQLSGNEKVSITANFASKPGGSQTDYNITGKPIILIDGKPMDFEYPVDNNDEITVSDMLMSMRASIMVNDTSPSTNENNVYQIRVFSNPDNITKQPNGTKTFANSPNNIEYLDMDGTFYYEETSYAVLYPNGTGILKANN